MKFSRYTKTSLLIATQCNPNAIHLSNQPLSKIMNSSLRNRVTNWNQAVFKELIKFGLWWYFFFYLNPILRLSPLFSINKVITNLSAQGLFKLNKSIKQNIINPRKVEGANPRFSLHENYIYFSKKKYYVNF